MCSVLPHNLAWCLAVSFVLCLTDLLVLHWQHHCSVLFLVTHFVLNLSIWSILYVRSTLSLCVPACAILNMVAGAMSSTWRTAPSSAS